MLFRDISSAIDYFDHLKKLFFWFDYVIDAPIDYIYENKYPLQIVKCLDSTDEWNVMNLGKFTFIHMLNNSYNLLDLL